MDRLTFDRICQQRTPEGDEVLAFIEAMGFRLLATPGSCRPVLTYSPGTPIVLSLEIEELFLDHAEAVWLALTARRLLYLRAGWREDVYAGERKWRRKESA